MLGIFTNRSRRPRIPTPTALSQSGFGHRVRYTYDLWQEIVFATGETAEDYLQVLRDYSLAFARSQS